MAGISVGNGATILGDFEVNTFINSLENISIEEIGSSEWLTLHERIEKLNMQALFEAQSLREERTKEILISSGKVDFLIRDLITTEVWRERVFSQMLMLDLPKTSMLLSIALHHEVTTMSLLEQTLFHPGSRVDVSESAVVDVGDLVLDLIDYCHRAIIHALAHPDLNQEVIQEQHSDLTSMETDLCRQRDRLRFTSCILSVGVLQYLSDQLQHLTISAASRLLRVHDTPLLVASLLQQPPWIRVASSSGQRQKFEDRRWINCPDAGATFTKSEGQCWVLLLRLLLGGDHAALYQISEHRRQRLLALQTFLTEPMLERLPPLALLNQWLSRLSLGQLPASRSPLIIETAPELWDGLIDRHKGSWRKLAAQQLRSQFSDDPQLLRQQAVRLAELYDLEKMATLLPGTNGCGQCGQEAVKRCARCKKIWYCGRQCQNKHWPQHKPTCDASGDST